MTTQNNPNNTSGKQSKGERFWIPALTGLLIPIGWLALAGLLFDAPWWYLRHILMSAFIGGGILGVLTAIDDMPGSSHPTLRMGLILTAGILPGLLLIGSWFATWGDDKPVAPDSQEVATEYGSEVVAEPFEKHVILGQILQYSEPLKWRQMPTSNNWEFDITNGDITNPVFLEQNYALMEDGHFWWKFPGYDRGILVKTGLNPRQEDKTYFTIRSKSGKEGMFDTTALYGVAYVNPDLARIYSDERMRPARTLTLTTGGELPANKEVVRVALTQHLDPASVLLCTRIPAGYFTRLHVRYADKSGQHLRPEVMSQPVMIDPDHSKLPHFPGFYLKGSKTEKQVFFPMGEQTKPNMTAQFCRSETEVNSFDPRWPKDEDVTLYVVTPAAGEVVRADVIIRIEPLD